MKLGTKYETNKVQGKDIFRRIDNPKLKDKNRKVAVDNCSGKCAVSSGAAQPPPKPRTHTHKCCSKNTQCEVVINLILSHVTNHWYLATVGDLHHKFHTALNEEHQIITENNCDKEDIDLMHVMYSVDTPPATIAKIMSKVRRKKGQSGQFLTKTLKNASVKHDTTIAHLKGINKNWTTAKKLTAKLVA